VANIHVPGDGHITPTGRHQWLAYPDEQKKKVVAAALFILKHNIRGSKPCNDCFTRLPGGRTFDDVLDDPAVFISFDPSNHEGDFGATIGSDVTITDFSIRMGRWTVAATLVHELAHVNGAPGGDSAEAESTLICCGLKKLFHPDIVGRLEGSSSSTGMA
jgi:hypothetical protein